MWHRTVDLIVGPSGLRIRHEGAGGPECRIRAALLRCDPSGGSDPAARAAFVVGMAWEAADGAVFWGWPDEQGRVEMRSGLGRPDICSLLPMALSLALALRRGGTELGTRALVIGAALPARVARKVAEAVGCRVEARDELPAGGARPDPSPDVVIETSGESRNLEGALECCRDWGTIFSMSGGLTVAPRDYYAQVHRRALSVRHVPERPVLLPGEEALVERGARILAGILAGFTPARDARLDVRIIPEESRCRLTQEGNGWGLLLVD